MSEVLIAALESVQKALQPVLQALQPVLEPLKPIHQVLRQKAIGPLNWYTVIILAVQLLSNIVPALFAPAPGGAVGASHILVKDEATAQRLLKELEKDPTQFAALAKQHSTCPSAKKGGSLGSFAKGAMVKEFDEYCFDPATEVGKVSPVIKTQFGYHLVVLEARL
ncbi:hypothetical protein HK100_009433 [Physocladia obscura]|uniref:Peptidyl-prolyl cis-trans isomerase n=1 Tax=Physocladia obscura TaxID=109957 RepID=A0AAD5T9B4_9FUNG|nr:hypothetical protein HK100_009433 [Physocladia obscura]